MAGGAGEERAYTRGRRGGGGGGVLGCTDRSIHEAGGCAVLVRGLGRGPAMGQDSAVRTSVRNVA